MRAITLTLLASGILMAASPALVERLHPQRYATTGDGEIARAAIQNRSAIGFIMGQVRTSISDVMFMKTEIYLHSGVRYEAHIDVEALESGGNVKAEDGQAAHDPKEIPSNLVSETEREVSEMNLKPGQTVTVEDEHGHEEHAEAPATIIPPSETDFRGFIGDIEREIKPWKPPGSPDVHAAGQELLPWYRMMTLSDPNNVRGYMIGAWWLLKEKTAKSDKEALSYLNEGVANNPDSFQVWLMKGRVHRRLDEVEEAIRAWDKARTLAMSQRPEGGTESEEWTAYMEDDFRSAIAAEVFTLRDLGRIDEAQRVAEETALIIPEFAPLQNFLKDVKEGKFKK